MKKRIIILGIGLSMLALLILLLMCFPSAKNTIIKTENTIPESGSLDDGSASASDEPSTPQVPVSNIMSFGENASENVPIPDEEEMFNNYTSPDINITPSGTNIANQGNS